MKQMENLRKEVQQAVKDRTLATRAKERVLAEIKRSPITELDRKLHRKLVRECSRCENKQINLRAKQKTLQNDLAKARHELNRALFRKDTAINKKGITAQYLEDGLGIENIL